MKRLTAFLEKLQLRRILSIFLAGILLIVTTTACNGANAQGANPNNPAVQAGGGNNPYKNGGDKYTNYRMSTPANEAENTKSNFGKKQANSELGSGLLVATDRKSEMLYPGAETPQGRAEKEAQMPIITEKNFRPKPGGLIQREADVGTRVEERLETVKGAVKDASGFLKDKAEEASARPELQKNPALGR